MRTPATLFTPTGPTPGSLPASPVRHGFTCPLVPLVPLVPRVPFLNSWNKLLDWSVQTRMDGSGGSGEWPWPAGHRSAGTGGCWSPVATRRIHRRLLLRRPPDRDRLQPVVTRQQRHDGAEIQVPIAGMHGDHAFGGQVPQINLEGFQGQQVGGIASPLNASNAITSYPCGASFSIDNRASPILTRTSAECR